MTDHKFTDDEIIKALNYCAEAEYCATCLARDFCKGMDSLMENSLALINRQKASLQEVITLNSKLEAENAKLQRLLDFYEETSGNKKAKAEAIKEFAQRLKQIDAEKEFEYIDKWGLTYVDGDKYRNAIDTLVKEMTETK